MTDPTGGKASGPPRSAPAPKDLPASVRGRLRNEARARGEDMLYVLSRYALERLLYRLGRSPFADQFVVKGALLFALWRDHPHRPTRDLDLLGLGPENIYRIRQVFADLCAMPLLGEAPDGLAFQQDSVQVTPIRETQAYGGLRVALWCFLGQTRIRVQVDIGFGDIITPAATYADFPSLIGLPSPHVQVYPAETVIAEKFEALVRLGAINSRVKDFYDLWALAHERAFSGVVLGQALRATFTRRGTPLPASPPACAHRRIHRRPRQAPALAGLREPHQARSGCAHSHRDSGVASCIPDAAHPIAALCRAIHPSVGAGRAMAATYKLRRLCDATATVNTCALLALR